MYIGFGSMVVQDPAALMQTVLQEVGAVQADSSTPLRVVVCSGWSGASTGGKTLDWKSAEVLAADTLTGAKQQLLSLQQQQQSVDGVKGDLLAGATSAADSDSVCTAAGAEGPQTAAEPEVFFTTEVSHEWLFPR
jgi:hypothetical protein